MGVTIQCRHMDSNATLTFLVSVSVGRLFPSGEMLNNIIHNTAFIELSRTKINLHQYSKKIKDFNPGTSICYKSELYLQVMVVSQPLMNILLIGFQSCKRWNGEMISLIFLMYLSCFL